jgi:hypothetical protein
MRIEEDGGITVAGFRRGWEQCSKPELEGDSGRPADEFDTLS